MEAVKGFHDQLLSIISWKDNQAWSFSLPLQHTIFKKENLALLSFDLHGQGDPRCTKVKAVIYYCINLSSQQRSQRWQCSNLEEALKKIFDFTSAHSLCNECGMLLETGQPCQQCLFFVYYRKYQGMSNQLCAICQEDVVRTTLSCGHSFHLTCLTKMNPTGIRCPVCRQELTGEEVEDFFFQDDSLEEL